MGKLQKHSLLTILFAASFAPCAQAKMKLIQLLSFKLMVLAAFVVITQKSSATTYGGISLDYSQLCDGLPRLKDIKTPTGFCMGLVDNGAPQTVHHNPKLLETAMIFPRSLVQANNTEFLLVDQGSKDSVIAAGQFFSIGFSAGKTTRTLLANKAYNPFGFPKEAFYRPAHISRYDELFYFGTTRAIFSFRYHDGVVTDIQKVISNIQISEDQSVLKNELHALKNFIFDNEGNLIVNIGSATNNCRTQITLSKTGDCTERDTRAQLRFYRRNSDGSYNPRYEIIAVGLRNSLTMAFHPNHPNWLFQGENSRDAIHKVTGANNKFGDGKTLPHEELNLIDLKRFFSTGTPFDFGWPYCYSNNLPSPEYPNVSCSQSHAPHILLPAHAAPLGMIFHSGTNWPPYYKNALLMSWHGYEYTGHRIVVMQEKDNGLPSPVINNLVWNWGIEGNMALGTPVQLYEAGDGSVFITEDNNQAIWRLYFDPQYLKVNFDNDTRPSLTVDQNYKEIASFYKQNKYEELRAKKSLQRRLQSPKPPLFSQIQDKLIDKHCAECHKLKDNSLMLSYNDLANAMLLKDKKLAIPYDVKASPFYTYLESQAMPPSGMDSGERAKLLKLVEQWILQGAPDPE